MLKSKVCRFGDLWYCRQFDAYLQIGFQRIFGPLSDLPQQSYSMKEHVVAFVYHNIQHFKNQNTFTHTAHPIGLLHLVDSETRG